MSAAVKKILVLSLALILSFTLVGCAEGGLTQAEGGLTQEEIDQIVANAATAIAEIDTGKADLDMSMTMNMVGGAESVEMTAVGDGTGAVDKVDKEMHMIMNMDMDISGQGEQKYALEYYIVGGWMYMMMEIPGQGEQWTKTELAETYDVWWLETGAEVQIKLLTTAIKVNYLGSEAVNGTDCYVFEVVPSMEVAGNLVSQQLQFLGMDLGQFNPADLLKEISAKQWIAKDSYLPMKAEVDALLEIHPEDVGATEDDFEKMTIDMNIGGRYYDYNQPVDITLPPEALNAPEMP